MEQGLQFRFKKIGTKIVLPLTTDNVECVFKKHGAFFAKGFTESLGIPDSELDDPRTAADWWIRNGKNPSWRQIIYFLDMAGVTEAADELIPYSEQLADASLSVENISKIYKKLKNWNLDEPEKPPIPESRCEVISLRNSLCDQSAEGAKYYVSVCPYASREHLAGTLFKCDEQEAIDAFRAVFPKQKDDTLTLDNLISAVEGVKVPEVNDCYLDMSDSKCSEILQMRGTSEDQKRALLSAFLSLHPYPRWELVIDLLEKLEHRGKARAGLAKSVKEKYLTVSSTTPVLNVENMSPLQTVLREPSQPSMYCLLAWKETLALNVSIVNIDGRDWSKGSLCEVRTGGRSFEAEIVELGPWLKLEKLKRDATKVLRIITPVKSYYLLPEHLMNLGGTQKN